MNIGLLCVFGASKGQKYPLKKGINRIGRGFQMDICVAGDTYITRDNHCSITVEEKGEKYLLAPTDGSMTYLNNELLSKKAYLKASDMIRIGQTEFELCEM